MRLMWSVDNTSLLDNKRMTRNLNDQKYILYYIIVVKWNNRFLFYIILFYIKILLF